MRRFILTLLFCLLPLMASAQYFKGFSVKAYKITSAWPTSLHSVKGSAAVTVGNTADRRTLRNIKVMAYRHGKSFAQGSCDDVTFYHGTSRYDLQGRIWLSEGVSTWEAVKAAFSFKPTEYTVDFTLDIIHANGKVDHVKRVGVPITRYLYR